jgi:hypothetical protein
MLKLRHSYILKYRLLCLILSVGYLLYQFTRSLNVMLFRKGYGKPLVTVPFGVIFCGPVTTSDQKI